MGRKKIHRSIDEVKEYNARRQREWRLKNKDKVNARYMELYYENKERRASDEEV